MTNQSKILVTGATGKVGRHIVNGLLERNADFRAMARDPERANLPDGVEAVHGDLTDSNSMKDALENVETVFLLWMADDSHAPSAIEEISNHAGRVVYLSSEGVRDDTDDDGDDILASHARMEKLVEDSGVEWTFLRPTGFASNTLGWADDIRKDGVVHAFRRGTSFPHPREGHRRRRGSYAHRGRTRRKEAHHIRAGVARAVGAGTDHR